MTAAVLIEPAPDAPAAARSRPFRFLLAGGINTLFGLAIYPVLLWCSASLHRHYMVGLAIAQASSLVFTFTTYKILVFRTRKGVLREIGRFFPFYLANYALSLAALPLLVKGLHLDPIYAQFGFSLVVMVTSYVWHSRVTFRTPGVS